MGLTSRPRMLGALLGAVLLGGTALTACSSGGGGGTTSTSTSTSKTTTTVTSATTTTSKGGTTTSTTVASAAPNNLVATAAVKSALTASYVAHTGLAADQVAGTAPGSVYYAYVPLTGTYWATASFLPAATASEQTKVSMQDDGCCGVFDHSSGATEWNFVTGYLGEPCPGSVPANVMTLWNRQYGSDCPSTTSTT
jgi:hypothetical protein